MSESTRSHCTYLRADHWGMAAKACLSAVTASQDNLAILYVGPGLAPDLSSILTFLRAARPQTHWQIATVPAVFCRDWFSDHSHAVAMISLFLPPETFHATIETVKGWQTVAGTVQTTPPLCVLSASTQCWTRIAEPHAVTEQWENTILGLDGRSALSVFKQDIGPLLARDLRRAEGFIHIGLVDEQDTLQVCLKLLCDERHGCLIIDPPPEPGQKLQVIRRDQNMLRSQITTLINDLHRLAGPRQIIAAHFMGCPSRHDWVHSHNDRDHALLSELLGDIPFIGALSNQAPIGSATLSLLCWDDAP